MIKVAYNGRFGGFSLSDAAVRLGREKSGDSKWAGVVLHDEKSEGRFLTLGPNWNHIDDVPRHDPVLVEVIEELGAAASGACANILIEEVQGKYRITEYDRYETVETPESIDWIDPLAAQTRRNKE